MNIEQLRKKYKYIVAWGIYTGSYEYYRDDQVRLAEKEGAPVDAIFKGSVSGEWVRFGEAVGHARDGVNFIIAQRGL